MRGNRRRDSKPELALRSQLHRRGWRFRVDLLVIADGVRTRPDIVFTRRRVAVFVDGCFWHCCPQHGKPPKSHTDYWSKKLARNVQRDERDSRALRRAGWTVVRLWEHVAPADAVASVESALSGAVASGPAKTA